MLAIVFWGAGGAEMGHGGERGWNVWGGRLGERGV